MVKISVKVKCEGQVRRFQVDEDIQQGDISMFINKLLNLFGVDVTCENADWSLESNDAPITDTASLKTEFEKAAGTANKLLRLNFNAAPKEVGSSSNTTTPTVIDTGNGKEPIIDHNSSDGGNTKTKLTESWKAAQKRKQHDLAVLDLLELLSDMFASTYKAEEISSLFSHADEEGKGWVTVKEFADIMTYLDSSAFDSVGKDSEFSKFVKANKLNDNGRVHYRVDAKVESFLQRMRDACENDKKAYGKGEDGFGKKQLVKELMTRISHPELKELFVDHGIYDVFRDWLSPMYDNSYHVADATVRHIVLSLLFLLPIRADKLRQSQLTRTLMQLQKATDETEDNKATAKSVVEKWISAGLDSTKPDDGLGRQESVSTIDATMDLYALHDNLDTLVKSALESVEQGIQLAETKRPIEYMLDGSQVEEVLSTLRVSMKTQVPKVFMEVVSAVKSRAESNNTTQNSSSSSSSGVDTSVTLELYQEMKKKYQDAQEQNAKLLAKIEKLENELSAKDVKKDKVNSNSNNNNVDDKMAADMEFFSKQLDICHEWGYTDDEKLIALLNQHEGNVELVIASMLE